MFNFQKHIPRRTFLRGAGVSLTLPFLDAMLPAQSLSSASTPQLRTAFLYMMHGAIMHNWTPAQKGANFEFSRILKPLEPYRQQILVVSGLEAETAGTRAGRKRRRSRSLRSGIFERCARQADCGRRRVSRNDDRSGFRKEDRAGHGLAVN
jgi:hypothetical protein